MTKAPDIPSAMAQAALSYARRGWPVFPCRERDGEPYFDKRKEAWVTPKAKSPYIKAGVARKAGEGKATTDSRQILAWWRSWPDALIGLPMGENGLFALDFDPRVEEVTDPETGEVTGTREWTLEQMKVEVEAQIGGPLPVSLAVRTPSGGVHVYYRQPDDGGEPLRNRGVLPRHVDVRGQGGYVIAPPSRIVEPCEDATPGEYRFLRGKWDAEAEPPPAALVEVLRAPKARQEVLRQAQDERGPPAAPADAVDSAVRRYALAALDGECEAVRTAGSGHRNAQLNESALKIASLVAAGALGATIARQCLEEAARSNPGRDSDSQLLATIDSGWSAGMNNPRDLSEVAAAARSRSARPGRSSSRSASFSRPRTPENGLNGKPSSQAGGEGGKAVNTGSGGGGEDEGEGLTRRCAFHPLTDLGNLERFLERYGGDFLHVEAWGWLAWDRRRWNRDMAEPLLGLAFQRTIRAIQEEADFVRSSGVAFADADELARLQRGDGEENHDERTAKLKALMRIQSVAKRVPDHGGPRLDSIAQVKSNGDILLYSDKLATWGRASESAGHIGCLAQPKMAPSRLAARTEDFDVDPLKLNVLNGTLVFLRPDEGFPASVEIREHRREDRITKLALVEHEPKALCPKYDSFLEVVQPIPEMREFLDVWAGYNSLGLADAQKFALFYGEGSNGKGVWINTHAYILGDYAWAAAIETFIDQGRYRKGSDASPDLAALAGRRMVYANEPEENSKFSDGLIKELTSDEPKGGVRELMKAPFELQITFTNTVTANTLPRIGTDHGIQRRVQVVPWDVIISDARADPLLKSKLKAEASGILNRMIRGALQFLTSGLPMPAAVRAATTEYQEENDLLGQFLAMCVERVEGEVVSARPFWRVFAAWQTWSGQLPQSGKPWSEKHLNTQMRKKKFKIDKSNTNKWQDVALKYEASDFCEHDLDGKILRVVDADLPAPRTFRNAVDAGDEDPPPEPPEEALDDGLPLP